MKEENEARGKDGDQLEFNINELIEYKKLTTIFENEIENKENKLNNLTKIHEELKDLHDKTRQECNELNQRLLNVYNEKNDIENKYQSELSNMKHNIDRQRDIYEEQILKLSAYDPESLRLKLTFEIELKYKQEQYKRDLQIEELNESLQALKRQHELLSTEYELYKEESIRELNALRQLHDSELRDLMHKMKMQCESQAFTLDKEIKIKLEQEIEMLQKQITDLNTEIDSLRKGKEELLIEKNELKLISMKDIDKERFHNKILISENERLANQTFKLQEDIDELRTQNDNYEIENKKLKEEKLSYETMINDQTKEYALFKDEMIQLRNQLEIREGEINNTLNDTHKNTQMQLMQEIAEKEGYQMQINDLTTKLNEVRIEYKNYHEFHSKEFHDGKRDYMITKQENMSLSEINKELQNKLDNVAIEYYQMSNLVANYEKDYMDLQERYRLLAEKEMNFNNEKQGYESKLNERKKEIRNMNAYIEMLKDSKQNSNEIKKKYLEILEKKKYYKAQCKNANENVKKLISKLQPSERERELLYMREHESLFNNQSEESSF